MARELVEQEDERQAAARRRRPARRAGRARRRRRRRRSAARPRRRSPRRRRTTAPRAPLASRASALGGPNQNASTASLAAGVGAGTARVGDRLLQTVVAPEQLVADGDRRARRTARARSPRRSARAGAALAVRRGGAAPASASARPRGRAASRRPPRARRSSRSSAKLARVDGAHEGRRSHGSSAAAQATRAASRPLRGKRARLAQRQALGGAEARQVAPHVAALHRVDVERRVVPALRGEDRPEQEGPPAQRHAGGARQRLDPHRGRVGVGAGELEPELGRRRHRGPFSAPTARRRRSGIDRVGADARRLGAAGRPRPAPASRSGRSSRRRGWPPPRAAPWCDSTMVRLIDRPMPSPLGLVEKNGSKTCSTSRRREARAGVAHARPRRRPARDARVARCSIRRRPAPRHRLDGVAQQVQHHLLDLDGVAEQRGRAARKVLDARRRAWRGLRARPGAPPRRSAR